MVSELSTRAFVGLGSNLGDRVGNLQRAVEEIRALESTRVTASSRWYDTSPIGPEQPDYLNGVTELLTSLSPRALLDGLLAIERRMGRTRDGEKWGPRVIDLDLLAYGSIEVVEPDLQVPHPELSRRRFVLEPWAEIAGKFVIEPLGRTVAELCRRLVDAPAQRVSPWRGGPS